MKRLNVTFAICALLALTIPAYCQNSEIGQLLSGKSAPLTLTLKDLNSDWRSITANNQDDAGSYLQMMATMYNAGNVGLTYFTKGETITLGTDLFLVAYREKQKKFDIEALRHNNQSPRVLPERLTAESELQLTLLNLHTTTSITNIHVFDLQHAIDESKSGAIDAETSEGATQGQSSAADANPSSVSNLRQLSYGLIQYLQDNDDKFPDMKDPATVQKWILPYVKNKSLFVQPGTDKPYQPNATLSNHALAQIADPTTMVMYYETVADKDGKRWVAYVDGHEKQLNEADWAAAKKASKIP